MIILDSAVTTVPRHLRSLQRQKTGDIAWRSSSNYRLTEQCSTILLDNSTIHRASFPTFSCCHGSKRGKKKSKMCHEDGTLRARRFFRTASGSSTYLDESSSRTRRRRLKENHPLLPANSTASIPSDLARGGWTSESQTFYCTLLVTTIHQHDCHRGGNRARLTLFRSKRNEHIAFRSYVSSNGWKWQNFIHGVWAFSSKDCARWFVTLENRIGSGLHLQ